MNRRTPFIALALSAALLTTLAAPAHALFEVKEPLSKLYNKTFRTIISGTTGEFNKDNNILTVKSLTAHKGAAPGDTLQIQINAPESLRTEVKAGQPIIVFQGLFSSAVHVADHWYSAEALTKPGAFRINSRLGHDRDETFPGRTAPLVEAVEELKAGKSTLLDVFPDKLFPNPVQAPFTLPKDATAFAVIQETEKSPLIFRVATANGFESFIEKDGKLEPGPSQKSDSKDAILAGGTLDKRPVLIQGNTVNFLNPNPAATLKLPAEKILGLAIDDSSNAPSLLVLTPKNLTKIPYAAATAGAATSQPANDKFDDDKALTGSNLTEFHRPHEKGFTSASLAILDLNNDKRPDIIILTPEGTLTLLNRGFGTYLVNKSIAAPLLDPANTKTPALPLLASTPTTLYVLQKDGTVYTYSFPLK